MRSPRLVALTALALLLAACGGGSDTVPTTAAPTSAAPTTPAPSSTEAATTTLAPTTTEAATTTTEAPKPVWPLTGLPVDDPALAAAPAVVVKVGNYDKHPQRNSQTADIIYEEIINANVTRFAFVYHSQSASEVGPVRSGRRQDVDLLGSLNRPVFAWAGGNRTVTNEIEASDLVDLSQFRCQNTCYRSGDDSPVEFTLMFNVDKIKALQFPEAGTPPQQFQYRKEGEALLGRASGGIDIQMESYEVGWTWNPATSLYERQQNGRPDKDLSGELMTTDNVVVLVMTYNPGISDSPDAVSVGTGEAWVHTGGNVVHGTWTRADRTAVFTLVDDDGNPIKLTPGRTFIELPRAANTLPR
jgi:hypothetical protein